MAAARKTWRLMVLGVMVGVGAVAFAVWPKGPRLAWYTSPPYCVDELHGIWVQAQVLIPAGWVQRSSESRPPDIPIVVSPFPRTLGNRIALRPPLPYTWLPSSIRRWACPREEDATLEINFDAATGDVSEDAIRTQRSPSNGNLEFGSFAAYRNIFLNDRFHCVRYERTNHAEFESTYRQICESFRVVRE